MSKGLGVLLDSCSWDDIGNFLQTCIVVKNSLLQTKLDSRLQCNAMGHPGWPKKYSF